MRVIVRSPPKPDPSSGPALRLLLPASGRLENFRENLSAVLDARRPVARYFRDIFPYLFLPPYRPHRSLVASAFTHTAVVFLLWNLPAILLLGGISLSGRRAPAAEERYRPSRITWYRVAEQLPAIGKSVRPAQPKARLPHKQTIVSKPPAPDNTRQTIYQPDTPNIRIHRDVRLPNIVMWSEVQKPMPPVDLVKRSVAKLRMPEELVRRNVEIPEETANLNRRVSDLRTSLPVTNPNPRLPVEPAPDLPAPPPTAGVVGGGSGGDPNQLRRLVTVSVNPAPPGGPIDVPPGNRSGTFSMGSGGEGEGGGGGRELGAIHVPGLIISGPGSAGVPPAPVVASGPGTAGVPPASAPRANLPSPVRGSNVPPVARSMRPQIPDWNPRHPEQGFPPGKRVYTVYINMPNLSSGAGSWILRFAEIDEHSPGDNVELGPPVAVRKIDPGYVPSAIRDKVEGVVLLHAIIRKDGRVERVELQRGLDPRLDERAIQALQRWEFQPATRHGVAVDLEAVIHIPFSLPRAF